MTKVAKAIKTKEERVKLDPQSVTRIMEMFSSTDKQNHTVALSILDQCDVKENLPYLLMIYKFHGSKNQEAWKNEAPELMKNFKNENIKLDDPNLTWKTILNITKKKYPVETLQFLLDTFSQDLKSHVTEWGMGFIADYNLKLTPKE